MKVSTKIVDVLVEAGIDHVFGIPGGGVLPIFDALYDRRDVIKTVLVRDEQTGSCMAEMYGRLTGKPGVFMAQGPFAGSTGLFGVYEGFLTSTPMLTITDLTEYDRFALHAPFQCTIGEYGSIDLRDIFKAATKFTTVATTPSEAVQGVQLAIKHATSGRPGPTACLMRIPALTGEIDLEEVPKIYHTQKYLATARPAAAPEEVEKVMGFLMSAKRPVMIAGNGVHASKAYEELKEFAELLGIPVATSYQGKSSFPETHKLALGLMNMYGHKTALRTISEADVILIIGCRMKPQDTCFESPELIDPNRQKIIQIDIDPRNAGWVYPNDLGLAGDAKQVLRQMIHAVAQKGSRKSLETPYIKEVLKRKQEDGLFDDSGLNAKNVPILSVRVVKELRDILDPSAIVTLDGVNNRIPMLHYFPARMAGTCFAAAGIGAMSLSVPAAITAKLLYPKRQCVAVLGDGGMAMQIHALSTALQYGAPVTFVVLNDSVLGAVRDGQGDRAIASEFIDTNYAKIAEGFGCQGIRVEKPEGIGPALKKALESDKPTVVDVMTDKNEKIREKLISPYKKTVSPYHKNK
jgi:acetolactate synthase-1/2/3 large subunit